MTPATLTLTQVIDIKFKHDTSHSSVLKQLIDQLVKWKFAKRKEIEQEFISLLRSKTYRKTED